MHLCVCMYVCVYVARRINWDSRLGDDAMRRERLAGRQVGFAYSRKGDDGRRSFELSSGLHVRMDEGSPRELPRHVSRRPVVSGSRLGEPRDVVYPAEVHRLPAARSLPTRPETLLGALRERKGKKKEKGKRRTYAVIYVRTYTRRRCDSARSTSLSTSGDGSARGKVRRRIHSLELGPMRIRELSSSTNIIALRKIGGDVSKSRITDAG